MDDRWIADWPPSERWPHYTRSNAGEVLATPASPLGQQFVFDNGIAQGWRDGGAATLSSTSGSLCVVVRCDSSVMPGVIHVAVGPDPAALNEPARGGSGIFALCGASEGMWRIARATIGKS